MGHFFYGAGFGFLFSSLFFVLVVVIAGLGERLQRLGRWRFALEFLVVLFLVLAVTYFWAPEMRWIGEHRVPVKLVQIVLGVFGGFLLRLWFEGVLLRHLPPEMNPWPAPAPDERALGTDPAEAGAPGAGKTASGPEWTSLAIVAAIMVLAVTLPFLETMIRNASTLKVGVFELSVRNEQKTQYLATLPSNRDKYVFEFFLLVYEPEAVERRLKSDQRRYSEAPRKLKRAADDAMLHWYRQTMHPLLNCVTALLNSGMDVETVRWPLRNVANDWASAATAPDRGKAAVYLERMAGEIQRLYEPWSARADACKALPAKKVTPDARITDSFEFHRMLSGLQNFLEGRIAAIRTLERVGSRFRATEVNWGYMLGTYYLTEDPTFTKAAEYYEAVLTIAETAAADAKRVVGSADCPAKTPIADAKIAEACIDYVRFRKASITMKASTAYALALRGKAELGKARQLASSALKMYIADGGATGNDEVYLDHVDTFAYVTMIAAAQDTGSLSANDSLDAKAIACAERIFDLLSEQSQSSLRSLMSTPEADDFRTEFARRRSKAENYASHRAIAAALLLNARSPVQCTDRDKEYKEMLEGKL